MLRNPSSKVTATEPGRSGLGPAAVRGCRMPPKTPSGVGTGKVGSKLRTRNRPTNDKSGLRTGHRSSYLSVVSNLFARTHISGHFGLGTFQLAPSVTDHRNRKSQAARSEIQQMKRNR